MKNLIIIFWILCFLGGLIAPLYAASQAQEFLCEIGIKFYEQGRYDEALTEFNKALIIGPSYKPALKYIEMIEQMRAMPITQIPAEPSNVMAERRLPSVKRSFSVERLPFLKRSPAEEEYISELLLLQQEMINARKAAQAVSGFPPVALPEPVKARKEIPAAKESEPAYFAEKQSIPQRVIILDENFRMIMQPIEIEQGKSIVLYGKNIQRFLIAQPDILNIEQKGIDELLITGKNIGYTYVYIWDDNGRWTTEFLGIFPTPEGPTLEEQMRMEEERAGTFKLRYGLGWNSFEQGRSWNSLRRQNYSWNHNLALTGSTPYGNLDSNIIVRTLSQTTDLTYYTLGLTNGKLGNFKDFSIRGFDYSPDITNLVFPGSALRGIMLNSPAFDRTIDYTVFWGREGGGRYGNLSPGLATIKDSFLEGVDLNFRLPENSKLGFTFVQGSGSDRPLDVNRQMYDADAAWNLGGMNMKYDLGYNGDTFAHLFSGNHKEPNLNFNYELRDIDKNFRSITGESWRRGELGGLFNLDFIPEANWNISNRLDVYRDRLFPSLENAKRWNEDYDLNVRFTPDPSLYYRLNYTLENELGKLSERRYQDSGIGLNKTFELIRKINTSLDYHHSESQNPTSSTLDYINDKVTMGLRFNVIGGLYYFFNNEWNRFRENSTGNLSQPTALETGIDYNSQIFKTPFYQNLRFIYRNEEHASSALSFLSGEDYMEWYYEIAYRPAPDKEAYCSTRIRDVWNNNSSDNKRLEADFNVGMRFLWDSGVRWESVGNIEGHVFKDLNSNGLKEENEAPVEGVKVWLGKNKFQATDMFGYYKFKGVRAAKAHVTIDASTLPSGFVLTVPSSQEVVIMQGSTSMADFGIIAPSQISGLIFEDKNGNGEFDNGDAGVRGVVVSLEDNRKATTDSSGRYSFTNASTGKHTISLDLNSVPLHYLPQVAITKEATLFEGVTYVYNIPLKRVKE